MSPPGEHPHEVVAVDGPGAGNAAVRIVEEGGRDSRHEFLSGCRVDRGRGAPGVRQHGAGAKGDRPVEVEEEGVPPLRHHLSLMHPYFGRFVHARESLATLRPR